MGSDKVPSAQNSLELKSAEDHAVPLLTAEEEMQYQRALWVNRLLKEQLAAQTQGLSIQEIEEAQAQIQARMREASRLEAWRHDGQGPQRVPGAPAAAPRSFWSRATPRRQQATSTHKSHFEVNRKRDNNRIQQENWAFLQRLESVRSTFTPRVTAPSLIPKLSPRSRLLGPARD